MSGTWHPWEYENPPMVEGEEYRTTERYMGKPVYARLYAYPGVTSTGYGEVLHGIADIKEVIRANGILYDETGEYGKIVGTVGNQGGTSYDATAINFVEVSKSYVAIYAGGNLAGKPLKVAMYYTKTTD